MAERLLDIVTDDEIGKNLSKILEIVIEILSKWKHKGVGYRAICTMLHDEADIHRCEEENIRLTDEKIKAVAQKFNAEPRKLLSHVLEYKLVWD